MFNFKNIKLPPKIKQYIKWASGPVLLGIISYLLINPTLNHLSGPDQYLIYTIGNFSGEQSSRDIRDQFVNRPYQMDIDGVPVFKKSINDHGDPDEARKISERLVGKDNTLMIVGHFLSSTTKAALPAYLYCKPEIPVILTTETNPNLIPNHSGDNFKRYHPVYALSPDDNNQAMVAAKQASRDAQNTNFWVVQDNKNRVYSSFLAMHFIEAVQKNANKKVMLLTDINSVTPFETIRKLKIDCIFFAGDWQSALILTNQVNAMYDDEPKKPKIILSDWCVDGKLIEQGRAAVKGIYLTHQMKRRDFLEHGGWGVYGKKAARKVEIILNDARNNIKKTFWKRWLGVHRVEDARKAIKRSMYNLLYKPDYKYREETDFHVWQIIEAETEDGKTELRFADLH